MRSPIINLPLILCLCNYFISSAATANANDDPTAPITPPLTTDEHGDYNGLDIIQWINSHPQGEIHPSLRIGRERPGDPTSINGLYVKSDNAAPIEKGDAIARIPWERMIHPDGKYSKERFFSCRAVYNLARELALGERSDRAPYVRYLLTQPRGAMPGEWTAAGQGFFSEVLGNDRLPPYEDAWRTRFDREWLEGCAGSEDDETTTRAYWLASSRDEDSLMVPIYDMANHSNDPALLNTLSYKPEKAGDSFRFVASKRIMPGEQIYNSYNRCNQCSDVRGEDCETFSFHRTSDLLTSFGFTEGYPQNWQFDATDDSSDDSSDDDDTEFEFCLERDDASGELEAVWESEDEMPDEEDVAWLKRHLKRLKKLRGRKDGLEKQLVQDGEADSDKMTRWEWDSIWRYHESLYLALNAAIESVDSDSGDEL